MILLSVCFNRISCRTSWNIVCRKFVMTIHILNSTLREIQYVPVKTSMHYKTDLVLKNMTGELCRDHLFKKPFGLECTLPEKMCKPV